MKTTYLLCLVVFALGFSNFASAAQITFGVESGSSIKSGQKFTVVGKSQGVSGDYQKNIMAVGQLAGKPLTVERISTANFGTAPTPSSQFTAQADGVRSQALGSVPADLGVILVGISCQDYMGYGTFKVNTARADGRICGEATGYYTTTCTLRSVTTASSASACKSALSSASDVTLQLTSGDYSVSFNTATQVACAILSDFNTTSKDVMGNVISTRRSKQEYFDGNVAYCSCSGGTCTMGVI